MRLRILVMICVGLLAFAVLQGASTQPQNRHSWEYKVVETWDDKQMTNLGLEGWELVAVDASRGDRTRAFFKRPL